MPPFDFIFSVFMLCRINCY